MIRNVLTCLAVSLSFLPFSLAKDPPADGWVEMTPAGGKLDANWKTEGNWSIDADGVVSLTPRKGEKGWTRYKMYLWAKKPYTDFEADFEYKHEKGGNSGFFFHVADDLKDPPKNGIEVQIIDSANNKGKLNFHDFAGGVIPGVAPTKNAAKPAGEWNRMQVTVKGKSLKVVLNGELVNDASLDKGDLASRPATGLLGIQDHGQPFWLKNVKVREIK